MLYECMIKIIKINIVSVQGFITEKTITELYEHWCVKWQHGQKRRTLFTGD